MGRQLLVISFLFWGRFFGGLSRLIFCLLSVPGTSWPLLAVPGCSWAALSFPGLHQVFLGVPGFASLGPLGHWFFAIVGVGSLQSDSKKLRKPIVLCN